MANANVPDWPKFRLYNSLLFRTVSSHKTRAERKNFIIFCFLDCFLKKTQALKIVDKILALLLSARNGRKSLLSPRMDSKESIPPAYVAWRAGTITLFLLGS